MSLSLTELTDTQNPTLTDFLAHRPTDSQISPHTPYTALYIPTSPPLAPPSVPSLAPFPLLSCDGQVRAGLNATAAQALLALPFSQNVRESARAAAGPGGFVFDCVDCAELLWSSGLGTVVEGVG